MPVKFLDALSAAGDADLEAIEQELSSMDDRRATLNAARKILQLKLGKAPPRQPKSAARVSSNGDGKHPLDQKDDRRRAMVKHLAKHGPTKQADLARALDLSQTTISVLAAHHWFSKTADGLQITNDAKEDVLKVG
jgi:hypothetical protein